MEKFMEFISGFNLQTLLSMAAMLWYFTRDIKNSIDTLDRDVRHMNTRVGRLEGAIYSKEELMKE